MPSKFCHSVVDFGHPPVWFGCSTNFVVLFGLVCGLCVGMMVLVVTATFHTGFYCNRAKSVLYACIRRILEFTRDY